MALAAAILSSRRCPQIKVSANITFESEITIDANATFDIMGACGDGTAQCMFDGQHTTPLFVVNGELNVKDISFNRGLRQMTDSGFSDGGGAIQVLQSGVLRAFDCAFVDNRILQVGGSDINCGCQTRGSAISSAGSSLVLVRCSFIGNSVIAPRRCGCNLYCNSKGGAIWLHSGTTQPYLIEDCTFVDNTRPRGWRCLQPVRKFGNRSFQLPPGRQLLCL
jgi:hypothetical protein